MWSEVQPCESCLNDIKVLGTKPSLKRTDVIQIYLNVNRDVSDVATAIHRIQILGKRANREHFPMPNPKILHRQKHPLPDLLEYFAEEITSPWLGYCIENLADLTVEMARNHLITSLIPTAAATRTSNSTSSSNAVVTDYNEVLLPLEEDAAEEEVNCMPQTLIRDCLLPFYLETPISISTTWRWLKRLGFNHDARKKSFFVDGHERPNVVFRRNEFCTTYLTKHEPRTHRWIQVEAKTVEEWKRENKMSEDDSRGYNYISDDNRHMVEFHVDDLDLLHDYAATIGFGSFGGNLSVRKPSGVKPLMIFGQDESVYSQFLFGNRQWVGPEGQRPLLPKTDGLSLMISALQSRETGFGVEISQMQMDEINESRRGKTYVDVDAAMAIHGQAAKKDLKQSPFVVYFELGANNEGYWTSTTWQFNLRTASIVLKFCIRTSTSPSSLITLKDMQRNWKMAWMPIA